MLKFKSFSVNDPSKEAISKIKANTLEEAIDFFAAEKKLARESFIRIFSVEQCK